MVILFIYIYPFIRRFKDEKAWKNITGDITTFYSNSIRGSALNDIVIAGANGNLLHFNGMSWKDYRNKELPSFIGNYNSVSIKGNVICAVGVAQLNGTQAIITLGKR